MKSAATTKPAVSPVRTLVLADWKTGPHGVLAAWTAGPDAPDTLIDLVVPPPFTKEAKEIEAPE